MFAFESESKQGTALGHSWQEGNEYVAVHWLVVQVETIRELTAVAVSAAGVADACIWLVSSGHESDVLHHRDAILSSANTHDPYISARKTCATIAMGMYAIGSIKALPIAHGWPAHPQAQNVLQTRCHSGTTAAPPGTSEKFIIHGLEWHGLPRPSSSQIQFINENDTVRQALGVCQVCAPIRT